MLPKQDPELAIAHSLASAFSLMVAETRLVLGCLPNAQPKS